MKVINGLTGSACFPGGCVVAAGNFDGVHLGHQEVFTTAVNRARELHLPAVLLTFSSHPLTVVDPSAAPLPLMTVEDRLAIARRSGFEAAIVLDFDQELASMAPGEFAARILAGRIGVRELVAGKGWRFGRGRSGDMGLLSELGADAGFTVKGVGPVMVDERPLSSTWVRESLARGDVDTVTRLLGRPHFVRGKVIHGEGRGRELGFPTVNLDCHGVIVPAQGVYAGAYKIGNAVGPVALSVGAAPTFPEKTEGERPVPGTSLEGHLLDMDGDLYGQLVTIAFTHRLRDQKRYPDAAALSEQIARDVLQVRELFHMDALAKVP